MSKLQFRNKKDSNSIFTLKNLIIVVLLVLFYVVMDLLVTNNVLNRQARTLIVPICINIILAVSLNLTTGFLGELSLGHAGFMAIGAYAGALFTLNSSLPPVLEFILAIIIGGIFAGAFGIIIGVPVLRLRGDYLAIVTLAFGEIIKSVINTLGFTGGAMGLSKIPKYSNYRWGYILVILTVVLITNIVNSRHGRAIKAIRDNYIAAEAMGIKVSKYKILAFVVAAFFAGVGGVLYGHNLSILKPDAFDYNMSIEILVIVVLGGMGSIKGSVIGAIILTLLPEFLRSAEELRMLLYAVALIVMMLYNKSGIREKINLRTRLPQIPLLNKKDK